MSWIHAYPATKEIRLGFLHPEGPARSYNYPRIADILVIDSDDILHIVYPTIIIVGGEGWVYAEQPQNVHQPQAAGSVSGRGGWVFKHVGAL